MAEFTNQASLIYNDNVINSNVVVGDLVQALEASKTAVRAVYSADGDITYVISITNNSGNAYNGLTVTDDLGAYTYKAENLVPLRYTDGSLRYFVNGVLQPALTPAAGVSLVISGVNVPANGNVQLIYEARPTVFAPLEAEAEITNTAAVTGAGIAEPVTASSTISAASGEQLSISKSLSPSSVTSNGQVTYTFVIQNAGNIAADAALGAVVTDTFSPVLKNLAANFNGTPLVLNTDYTYDETTGVFATVPGTITVGAAAYTRNETTGAVEITPAVSILTVTGTI